jgi:hypothetical protein
MAQNLAIEYFAGMSIKANTPITTAAVIAIYPTAQMMRMKTEGISVSINSTDMFLTHFDDEAYITTGKTYMFDKDCIISVGRFVAIA